MPDLETAARDLARLFQELSLPVVVGYGLDGILVYAPNRSQARSAANAAGDTHQGHPVRVVRAGRIQPAARRP